MTVREQIIKAGPRVRTLDSDTWYPLINDEEADEILALTRDYWLGRAVEAVEDTHKSVLKQLIDKVLIVQVNQILRRVIKAIKGIDNE